MGALPAQRVEMISVDRVTVINPRDRNKKHFKEIIDNIASLGLKKPITVTRRIEAGGPFYDLVCGQGRLEAYIALGEAEVPALVVTADPEDCLVASLVENCARRQHHAYDLLQDIRGMEERGYTPVEIARKTGLTAEYVYGVARLSRIAIIQEHRMILAAVERGLPEERLARALNVNVAVIRKKRNLLVGICPEVAEMLKDRHVPLNAFSELRRLKPMRQIRAAEMMVAMNRYSLGYVRSIVAATPTNQLVEGKTVRPRGLTSDQVDLMTEESAGLDREFKLIEQAYGADHLDLVLAVAYLAALLENARVVRHLAQHHGDLLREFHKLASLRAAA